jgi:hypothetical protein
VATYCYRCKGCGASFNVPTHGLEETPCPTCGSCCLTRDYRAENVGVATVVLKNEREMGSKYKDLFLPSNKDFAGPGDPDGTKGMRNWRETHQPKAGNKNPDWPGTVDRTVM